MQNCYTSRRNLDTDDQNERLTTKHIQTLSFLQDIVNENKQLKERITELEAHVAQCGDLHSIAAESKEKIKEIQETYLKRADEINEMLIEKHKTELMRIMNEKLQDEQKWILEKRKLESDIEKLKKELSAGSQSTMEQESQLQMLTLKADAMEQENDRLTTEVQNLEQINSNQLIEIQKLAKNNTGYKKLSQEIDSLCQKNRELRLKVEKLEKELEDTRTEDQDKLIDMLKTKLSKLHKEKSTFTEKEENYTRLIDELRTEVEGLKSQVESFSDEKLQLLLELEYLERHVHNLETQLQKYQTGDRDRSFKDFVAVKRAVILLQDENDDLKQKLIKSKSTGLLPVLKEQVVTDNLRRGSLQAAGDSRRDSSIVDQRRSSFQPSVDQRRGSTQAVGVTRRGSSQVVDIRRGSGQNKIDRRFTSSGSGSASSTSLQIVKK